MLQKIKKRLLICLLVFLSNDVIADGTITWLGCGITKNAFTKEIADAFLNKTGIQTIVRGGGALKGIRDSASGRTDIGGTCRPTLDLSQEQDVRLHHIAWDALAFIVPESNPVANITSEQVHGIIDGTINNWSQLGGDDHAIEFYTRRGKLSGVGHMFRIMFFQDAEKDFPYAIEVPRSSGLVEMLVGKGAGTLGISGAASAHKRAGIKMLSIDGVFPSKQNILSGKYYLIRPLYYSTGLNPSAETRQFIDFALSDEGQKIIANEGVVNIKEGEHLLAIFKQRFGEENLAASLR